jgi:hypothetical protein
MEDYTGQQVSDRVYNLTDGLITGSDFDAHQALPLALLITDRLYSLASRGRRSPGQMV